MALQRVAVLAGALGMTTTQTIDAWLDGMCKQGSGKKDPPELAASKKVVLATCLQLMVNDGRANAARTLLATKPPVTAQTLLDALPAQTGALRSQITDKEGQAIEKKSKGYNLMALMALPAELAAYDQAALVRCAKKTQTCQELVALTNVADSYLSSISTADRISIAAHYGGWKNLETATTYLDRLWNQRTTLEANALAQGELLTQEEIDHALAPFTIAMQDMVRILSHDGGSKNLEAATAYLDRLWNQRSQLTQQGLIAEQIGHTLAPFTIAMQDMVRILSHGGGSKNLEAATAYLDRLGNQRSQLAQQGLTAEQIDHVLAPFTIPMVKLVGIVAQRGGSLRLSERLKEMHFQ